VIYEHYHRYALAARFTAGMRVLDLACGEAFGTALLGVQAREVVGSMIDPELLGGMAPFDVITASRRWSTSRNTASSWRWCVGYSNPAGYS
jgi:hypothetical protein